MTQPNTPKQDDKGAFEKPQSQEAVGGKQADKFCVFCEKIKNKKLRYVYPAVVMFEPLNPVTPGHKLFVPVEHVVDAADNLSVTARVFREASKYLRELGGDANLITSKGTDATQSVFHLHVHVVPRRKDDGLHLPWTTPPTDAYREGYWNGVGQHRVTDLAATDPEATDE